MELLTLVALDADDLAVVSTHLQDAVIRAGDLAYLAGERRFALVARRFDWEVPSREEPRRRLSGLQVARVLGARTRAIPQGDPDAVLSLLALTFEAGEAPSGVVALHFAGGGTIRLEVECIEVALKDLGPVWRAASRPDHAAAEHDTAEHDTGSDVPA